MSCQPAPWKHPRSSYLLTLSEKPEWSQPLASQLLPSWSPRRMLLHLSHPEGPVGTHSRSLFLAQTTTSISHPTGQKPDPYMAPTCCVTGFLLLVRCPPTASLAAALLTSSGPCDMRGALGAFPLGFSRACASRHEPLLPFSSLSLLKCHPPGTAFPDCSKALFCPPYCPLPPPPRATSTGRFYTSTWIL